MASRLVDRASNSDLARNESLRNAGRVGREKLGAVYEDMKRVGERVLEAIREAAVAVRTKSAMGDGMGWNSQGSTSMPVPVSATSAEPDVDVRTHDQQQQLATDSAGPTHQPSAESTPLPDTRL